MSVRKLKAKTADTPKDLTEYCYLCGAPANDNLVGVAHMKLCDFEKAVETGEEHWYKAPVCTKCFVKTRGAVFTIKAMKKSK